MAATAERPDEDPSARLGALFDAHHQRLYRLARRLAGGTDDARDLVQETFLRAARSPRSVPEDVPNQEAWLVRIAQQGAQTRQQALPAAEVVFSLLGCGLAAS